ncbi:MAG: HlyD family efflux transporter periplasmic adaptor subunit [Gammaproteobacteria bacterium]|nr:HlyD family efflux transporter periplasmic adaptor subunit [Gammaproteobacteria bacterium]MXW44819.1 HlyD family efflux transporter periplasmic adaptor subunit [Gammaproteobacteria bacterium]MYD02054.1 HlyD family efflux transporter periplasmic adaptor subunit [Gammaproteobacteria bacterium]MYI24015.1 HlyD family efflux transporter periplasmic adaptor subunit [Gammaproteobacteria bacterium]
MGNHPPRRSDDDSGLFRENALSNQRHRFLGKVLLAGPASTPFAVLIACTCLAALMALAFVIRVPSRLHAPGVLLPVGGLTTISAEQGGVVEEILVKPGDIVSAGSTLIMLAVDRTLADGIGSYRARFVSTAQQRQLLLQRRDKERKAFDARLHSMNLERAALTSTLELLRTRIQNAARQAELADADYRRLKALASQGHAAKRDVDPAELRWLQAMALLDQLRSQQIETQSAIDRIAQEMVAERQSFQALYLNLEIESERLTERAVELDGLSRRAVVAPMRGQLADVLVSAGKPVTVGDALATIHPPGAAMEARLYLSSVAAGRAEAGQEAVLKLPAFPSRQFGVLRGTLTEITSSPLEAHAIRLVPNLLAPAYEARVTLKQQDMQARDRRWPLRPGLSVDATIIETRRTLMRWLLDPLVRGASDISMNLEEPALANLPAGI